MTKQEFIKQVNSKIQDLQNEIEEGKDLINNQEYISEQLDDHDGDYKSIFEFWNESIELHLRY